MANRYDMVKKMVVTVLVNSFNGTKKALCLARKVISVFCVNFWFIVSMSDRDR